MRVSLLRNRPRHYWQHSERRPRIPHDCVAVPSCAPLLTALHMSTSLRCFKFVVVQTRRQKTRKKWRDEFRAVSCVRDVSSFRDCSVALEKLFCNVSVALAAAALDNGMHQTFVGVDIWPYLIGVCFFSLHSCTTPLPFSLEYHLPLWLKPCGYDSMAMAALLGAQWHLRRR